MNQSKIGIRYAKALFELAMDKKLLDVVQDSMKRILGAYQNKAFVRIIESPVIDPGVKHDLIMKITGSTRNPIMSSFMDLVMKNDREKFLKYMALHYNKLYKKHQNVKEVHLTTATSVNEDIKSRMKQIMEGTFNSAIEFSEELDKDIIGGFIARVDDLQFDASISTQLNKIRKEFIVKK